MNYLNKLRDTVARILCCPPEKVSVRGVQETHSLIVTLEIPEMCNVILYNLNRCKWEQLVFVDVDKYRKKGGEFIELGTRRPGILFFSDDYSLKISVIPISLTE